MIRGRVGGERSGGGLAPGPLMRELGLPIGGIVHVGAHKGEEVAGYLAEGFSPVVLVEPNPVLAGDLQFQWPQAHVVQAAAGRESGTTTLYVTDPTELASTYRPLRSFADPVSVPAVRLADVVGPLVTAAVVDAQGAELDVVAGAPLDQLRLLVLETRIRAAYEGAPLHDEVVAHMDGLGWRIVRWVPHGPPQRATVWDVVFTR